MHAVKPLAVFCFFVLLLMLLLTVQHDMQGKGYRVVLYHLLWHLEKKAFVNPASLHVYD